jgi:predicted O-methyltransferase YrrM
MSKKYSVKIDNSCKQNVNYNGKPTREHFIDSLIKKNSWTVGVEVGTRIGRTLFHLLDNNPTLKMYSVDKDISQFYNTKIKEKYKDRLIVLEGSSWEQSSNINEKIDFVFIDASHTYKNVVKDIKAYSSLLKTTAGLLGHDINMYPVQDAVIDCGFKYLIGPDNVWLTSF